MKVLHPVLEVDKNDERLCQLTAPAGDLPQPKKHLVDLTGQWDHSKPGCQSPAKEVLITTEKETAFWSS
uniref:Uncharacterized protein n=1 Tax=Sphaerodactylus townsendi TaxID=933632 RepID=A0ACB8FMY7_9SAUR